MKPPSIAVIAKLELPKFRIKGIRPVPQSCNTVPNAMILIYCVAYVSTCPSAPKRSNRVWAEKKVSNVKIMLAAISNHKEAAINCLAF